ncbi:hypothetical protein PR048_026183 [Dryococelus australis]|uniref:Uncharacterized protein n=1 Tax=Dryococelus australis TaxID=614101 RepID=A0ABQ9GKP9_9NEOP|nr:hypothetical protein PR048_026183 [Dryococelus australis]
MRVFTQRESVTQATPACFPAARICDNVRLVVCTGNVVDVLLVNYKQDIINNAVVVLRAAFVIHRRHHRRVQRKYWVHPILSERSAKGYYVFLDTKVKENPEKFFE